MKREQRKDTWTRGRNSGETNMCLFLSSPTLHRAGLGVGGRKQNIKRGSQDSLLGSARTHTSRVYYPSFAK